MRLMLTTLESLEQSMAAWALTQVGVPWVHQGRTPGVALDCAGLPVCAARAHGIELADNLEYSEQPSSSRLLELLHASCDQVDAPVLGGLILFWVRDEARDKPTHLGIYIGAGQFVHAMRSITEPKNSRVRTNKLRGFWAEHVHSYWRLRWELRSTQ